MQEKRLHLFVSLNKTARSLGRRLNNRHISLVFKQFHWDPMKKHFSLSVLTHCVSDATPYEPVHEISNNVVCTTSKASDQPAHTRCLIRAFACRLNIL